MKEPSPGFRRTACGVGGPGALAGELGRHGGCGHCRRRRSPRPRRRGELAGFGVCGDFEPRPSHRVRRGRAGTNSDSDSDKIRVAMRWNETQRLGTELEVVSEVDLTPLLECLRSHVSVIRNSADDGRHTLWCELVPTEADLDDAVQRYVGLVEALPADVRAVWDASVDRCLNTGIQAGWKPSAYPVQLSADSISRAARISVRHQFTVYAADEKAASSK